MMRISLLVLAGLAACTPELGDDIEPSLPLQDLGDSVLSMSEDPVDLSDPVAVWQASEHLFPHMGWGLPMVQTVDREIMTDLMSQRVADVGSCPYYRMEGSDEVMVTECRSSAGYHWTGSARTTTWREAGLDFEGVHYELEVTCDEDDRLFDRVALHGQVIVVNGTKPLLQHVESNIAISYEGSWDRTPSQAWREPIWADLRYEGWAEAYVGEEDEEEEEDVIWKTITHAKAGDLGTLAFAADDLLASKRCGSEPDGDSQVLASEEATFEFRGLTTCDSCVEYRYDGEKIRACP